MKRKLFGMKKKPTTDKEAALICQMFGLPLMSLKALNAKYEFSSEIPAVPYDEKLADEADAANEAAGLIGSLYD